MSENIQDYLAELACGEDERAEAAALALGELAQENSNRVIAGLKTLLMSDVPDHRWWALRALATVQHPKIAFLLARSLTDPAPDVRQCAAVGLRSHPDPQVIPHLIDALEDPAPLVADLAADALIAIGDSAVPALLEVMQGGVQTSRLKAVRALATIGDTRAVPALFAALDEDSAWMEYWATEGLERMGIGMMFFTP